MFDVKRIKSLIPFIMGFIAYYVVTTILNLLGKNTGIFRFTAFIIVILLFIILGGMYEKNKE